MNSYLAQILAADSRGIPLERFMQEALYHPEHGYYSRQAVTVGRRGDFSTSATLDHVLGESLAHWLRDRKSTVQDRSGWHVIELGAGSGALAKSILHHLGWWSQRDLHYHIVELSSNFQTQQQRLLRGAPIHWHREIESALRLAGGRALIFSNEFVDAFPCRVLQQVDGNWQEVWIRQTPLGWEENWVSLSETPPDPVRSLLSENLLQWPRVEIHQSYWQWLRSWAPLWKRGSILTIDYGEEASTLYFRRPHGTLRAYFQHQRLEGTEVYERFGRQDLTADINFSHLQDWGTARGWKNERYETQRDFLLRCTPRLRKPSTHRPEIAYLLDPKGPGGAFKVLEQSISSL